MITTVLLDLDDTILADDEATDAAFMATALQANVAAGVDPAELISLVQTHAAAEWREGPFPDWLKGIGTSAVEGLRARFEGDDPHWATMREWGPTFRHISWLKALDALDVQDDELARSLDMTFERERALTNPWCVGADEALTWLQDRYQLGMVTNGIPDVQRTKIDATELVDRFAAIVVSGEIGIGKPEPAIYQHVMSLLQVKPEECIMVGDNIRRDALGGQGVGIRGVWLSMGRDLPDGVDEPWLTIETLADLPARLQGME